MSSNRRARFLSMFIWTRSSWRNPFFPEPPPPTPPPPTPPPAPNHAPLSSTDPESSSRAGFSGDLVTILPSLPPPCLQILVSGSERAVRAACDRAVSTVACVPAAFSSRCRTFISVWINCRIFVGRVHPATREMEELTVRMRGLLRVVGRRGRNGNPAGGT